MQPSIEFFQQLGQFFSQSAFWKDPLMAIVQGIVWLACVIANAGEQLINYAFRCFDFIVSPEVQDFINSWRPLLWVLLAFALLMLGYQLIMNRDSTKPKVAQNLLIFAVVVLAMPQFLTAIATMTSQAVDLVLPSQTSFTTEIFKNNVADLLWLDQNDFDLGAGTMSPSFNVNFDNLNSQMPDFTDKVKPSDEGLKNPDIFSKKLKYDAYGNPFLQDVNDGSAWIVGAFEDNSYYRYSIQILPLLVSLVAIIIALFFSSYKVIRIIFELAISEVMVVLFSASDLNGGQRTKAILKNIASSFVVLFFVAVILKFFLLFNAYLGSISGIPEIVKAFLLVGVAIAVVDGPNLIEQMLGIDVGLSSSAHSFFAITRSILTAGKFTKGAGKIAVEGATKLAAKGAEKIRDGIGGLHDKQKTKNQSNDIGGLGADTMKSDESITSNNATDSDTTSKSNQASSNDIGSMGLGTNKTSNEGQNDNGIADNVSSIDGLSSEKANNKTSPYNNDTGKLDNNLENNIAKGSASSKKPSIGNSKSTVPGNSISPSMISSDENSPHLTSSSSSGVETVADKRVPHLNQSSVPNPAEEQPRRKSIIHRDITTASSSSLNKSNRINSIKHQRHIDNPSINQNRGGKK